MNDDVIYLDLAHLYRVCVVDYRLLCLPELGIHKLFNLPNT